MRRLTFLLFFQLFLSILAGAQYWQQQVNYTIDVKLDDTLNTLDGFERMEYINHSPDTLRFIWFHVWANAYKNDKTAYTDQSLQNGDTRFYFSDKEQKGYINRLDFQVDGITAETADHSEYIDIIRLLLPVPLLPGKTAVITTPFHVKLPYNFNRGGYNDQNFYIAHWYPKPAVYDKNGWHPMPMLEQGEYYSEFGNYDVSITLPDNYVVAATGELQNQEEKAWLKSRGDFNWQPEKEKIKVKGITKTIVRHFPASSKKAKTLHYLQRNIHDFAWFADKRFIVKMEDIHPDPERTIECAVYYLPGQPQWETSLTSVKKAILSKDQLIGHYPYQTVSVVQDISSRAGGTEYPTITALNAPTETLLESIINHETGHNWFYGALANNERQFPWMDEGINSYYDQVYAEQHTEAGTLIKTKSGTISTEEAEDILLQTLEKEKTDQPANLPADNYSPINYEMAVYHKTAVWMNILETTMGPDAFEAGMKTYFETWKFKHPYPEDFKEVMETSSGKNLDSVFSLLSQKGTIGNSKQNNGTAVSFFFNLKKYVAYIHQPTRNLISITPAIGVNSYDKFMAGLLITNAKLPPSRLQFFAVPLYAAGSGKLTGIGKINFSSYSSSGFVRKTDIFLNIASFSQNDIMDDKGNKLVLGFRKIVPGLRFTFLNPDPRSTLTRYVQWKSFFINEGAFRFLTDTVINGTDTSLQYLIDKTTGNRRLGQLKLVFENNRALYPWRAELTTELNRDFVRLGFTGTYFFNYAKGGGLNLRLFAGKFIYTHTKTTIRSFETDRYHLNMTGANGYEDYTYSDYFLGRNRFEKLPSQQIMIRDGGFKIRTDLLSDKIGKTDNWLVAANLTTSIPDNINPLSVLPARIPLKVFADIGTYADAWQKSNNLDKFLFEAGLQVSLLKETVNIYLPLIYSTPYKDYIRSVISTKKFAKTISFSIDLSSFHPRKINNNFSF